MTPYVYVVMGERNLGNEAWIEGVTRTKKEAVKLRSAAVREAKASGLSVYPAGDFEDWDIDFTIERHTLGS